MNHIHSYKLDDEIPIEMRLTFVDQVRIKMGMKAMKLEFSDLLQLRLLLDAGVILKLAFRF